MRGLQMARGALQAKSRVSLRRVASRSAWKKELLFWRRRETGVQDLKVELLRKVLKKSGQLWAVKLLPREVSNGTGIGVVMTVADGEVAVLVVELADSDATDVPEIEVVDDESVDDDSETDVVEVGSTSSELVVLLLLPSWRLSILAGRGGCL
jgi:hypothetical protein